jgi:peptidylprolyl isomerase
MTRLRRLAVPAIAALALFAAGCGDDDEEPVDTNEAIATETETPTPEPTAATEEGGDLKDTETKPAIPKPSGDPPTELVKEDIVTGKGKAAKKGDQVSVQYVGVSFSTGEEFDASWDRGEPFPFALGGGQVIPGWDEGIVGMKVGGRRQLTIPPDMAYGPAGSPPAIGPNETLIFVVDLLEIS